jgi:uncharacterized protein with HEPN domain
MDVEIKTWLYDILNAITEIDSFFEDLPKDFKTYKSDTKTRRAVERNIEIIGEATNRIFQKDDTIKLSNSRKIVDTRNRIIHGYDTVLTKSFGVLLFNIYRSSRLKSGSS